MDKSLDDLIKKNPKHTGMRRPRRAGARQTVLGKPAVAVDTAATKSVRKAAVAGKPGAFQQAAEKIMVSGLPMDVNEAQIKELFATTVGPVRETLLNYNQHGKWNGSAMVVFQRKGDGTKAHRQYNDRLIDGKKPMKIELMFDPASVPAPTLVSRVTPASATVKGGATATEGVQRNGGARRGRGRGGRPKNAPRPPKNKEDLDAEMEDYTAETQPTAPAAVPVA
ncbi:hypothetical protein DFH11DRAFT_1710520 [Phellopilus nigrolimitatus]|nr:hypothetical protein DFH11DRAFT_1710520 [Phellopilus nigrolimitatus]